MGICHIEIAGIDGSVGFDYCLISAAAFLFAGFGGDTQEYVHVVFKLADIGGAAF